MKEKNNLLNDGDQNNSNKGKSGDAPILDNGNMGVAAWIKKGDNGAYLSVKVSFIGNVNLFASNKTVQTVLNNVYDALVEEGVVQN